MNEFLFNRRDGVARRFLVKLCSSMNAEATIFLAGLLVGV